MIPPDVLNGESVCTFWDVTLYKAEYQKVQDINDQIDRTRIFQLPTLVGKDVKAIGGDCLEPDRGYAEQEQISEEVPSRGSPFTIIVQHVKL
jgi:hypothetical protein